MPKRFAGIDIGSRSIELVVDDSGSIVPSLQADTGFDIETFGREALLAREIP